VTSKKHKGHGKKESARPGAKAEEKYEEVFEKLQRVTADYLNYQKRMQRQMEATGRYALQGFISDILPVIDNFELALRAAEGQSSLQDFRDGIQLVHDELLRVLKRHDIEPIDAMGRPFDPEQHEAVAHVESADHEDNSVMEVVQRGYRLHSRTIRPSKVVVSKACYPEESEEQAEAGPEGDG